MIRSLRQSHRQAVMALGIFLPVAFMIGLAVRKPLPGLNSLPEGLATAATQFKSQEWQRENLFPKAPVQVRLLREHPGAGKYAVAFFAGKNLVKPDLLVYWVAGNSNNTDTLPDNAVLLGSFHATPLSLSDEMAKANGQLVLFSLADNEIVDVSKLLRLVDSAK